MNKKFHCEECAGFAKAKGEECSMCDGRGNPLPKLFVEKKSFFKKKVK